MSEHRDILLVGDAMVDAYLRTEPVGISDEAPVAVLDWVGVERTLGGMMNVAASCAACGGTRIIGLVGDDDAGRFLREETERLGIEARWIEDGRCTIEKMRVLAGDQPAMLARLDVEDTTPVDERTSAEALNAAREQMTRCGAMVVSDYRKGLITAELARELLDAAAAAGLPVIVDAKPGSMGWFKGATVLTPNEREARQFARENDLDFGSVDELGRALATALDAAVLITRGADGMTLFDRSGGRLEHFDAGGQRPLSTSGAGDVVVAAIAAGLARGAGLVDAARSASQAAARAVAREGTCRIEPGDL